MGTVLGINSRNSSNSAFSVNLCGCYRLGALALTLTLALLLIGCDSGGGGGGGGEGFTAFASLDIADAQALIIRTQSGTSSTTAAHIPEDTEVRKLLKLTDEGVVVEVDYLDEDGNAVHETSTPVFALDLNAEFVFFQIGYGTLIDTDLNGFPNFSDNEGFLVRKLDGAVFASPWGTIELDSGLDTPIFGNAQDNVADNNLYYRAFTETSSGGNSFTAIRRVNVSDPDQLLDTQVSVNSHEVFKFFVDSAGNVAYSGENVDSPAINEVRRIITADGTGINISQFDPVIIGLDGAIYGLDLSVSSDDLHRLTVDAQGNFTPEFYAAIPATILLDVEGWQIKFPDKIIFISQDGTVAEIFNALKSPTVINSISGLLGSIISVQESSNYLYLFGTDFGNTVLYRADFTTFTDELLLDGSEFEIIGFSVTFDDVLIFDAIRISDSVRIQGKIDAAGNLEIIAESSNDQDAVVIERLL